MESMLIDYLEVDQTIPGQNYYVCLSFLSPDKLIKDEHIQYS